MSDVERIFEDLLNAPVDVETAKEAKTQDEIPILRTGWYVCRPKNARWDTASEKSPWPGRLMLYVQSTAELNGQKVGPVRIEMSPQVFRNPTSNRLDGPSSLYGLVVDRFGLAGATNSKVLDLVKSYPMRVFIEEVFKTDEGWKTIKHDNEHLREGYIEKGFEPRNFIKSVEPVG